MHYLLSNRYKLITNVRSSLMAVNIHITIIELNALHTKRQNLFQELDAVIHLLMEAKHWGLRKSRNATSLNSRFKSLDTRSEERRVGKECRDRWWTSLKKKTVYRGTYKKNDERKAGVTGRHDATTLASSCLQPSNQTIVYASFFFSSRRRHTRSVSAFLLNRSSDLSSKSLMRLSICLWKPSIGD